MLRGWCGRGIGKSAEAVGRGREEVVEDGCGEEAGKEREVLLLLVVGLLLLVYKTTRSSENEGDIWIQTKGRIILEGNLGTKIKYRRNG